MNIQMNELHDLGILDIKEKILSSQFVFNFCKWSNYNW
jgi:hypothetical protein